MHEESVECVFAELLADAPRSLVRRMESGGRDDQNKKRALGYFTDNKLKCKKEGKVL